MEYLSFTSIGQDSHRFVSSPQGDRPLRLGGVTIPDAPALEGNSDADVLLHALANAVSGLTGVNVLGEVADHMCLDQGVTDSAAYLAKAMESLGDIALTHLSVSVEAQRPRLAGFVPSIRRRLSELTGLPVESIGLTATSGEGLTDFGRGLGIQVLCILSARRPYRN
jgi:2-C-methyl-D-erythritol 2,4-cyclodiphosphate synthase